MSRRQHTVAAIEAEAERVLTQSEGNFAPVDLQRVARYLQVGVHFGDLEGTVSGVLVVRGAERYALINAAHHKNRQRFSLAHELGHLVLHEHGSGRLFVDTTMRVYQRVGAPNATAYSQIDSTTAPHEEREANQFASALLMPKVLLEREASKLELSEEGDVAALARTFGVSDQAMTIRLQQLRLVRPVSHA